MFPLDCARGIGTSASTRALTTGAVNGQLPVRMGVTKSPPTPLAPRAWNGTLAPASEEAGGKEAPDIPPPTQPGVYA